LIATVVGVIRMRRILDPTRTAPVCGFFVVPGRITKS